MFKRHTSKQASRHISISFHCQLVLLFVSVWHYKIGQSILDAKTPADYNVITTTKSIITMIIIVNIIISFALFQAKITFYYIYNMSKQNLIYIYIRYKVVCKINLNNNK